MQLVVDGKVELLDTMKNRRIASAEVLRNSALADKVCSPGAGGRLDRQYSRGARIASDAAELINAYGDIEALLASGERDQAAQAPRTLIENAENARISLQARDLGHPCALQGKADEFGP